MGILKNVSTGSILATRVDRASSFLDRAVGLLARPRIRPDEGLWIERCTGIHTMGMRAPIDVIFVDAAGCIMRVIPSVPPLRLAVTCWKANAVIELGLGTIDAHDLLLGDRLELVIATIGSGEK